MPRHLWSARLGKVKFRTVSELLLTATLIAGVYYFFAYVPKHVKAGEPVVALAHYFLTYAPIEDVNQPAYVLPDAVEVWDTPAEIRARVATLKSGDEVQALGHFRDWTRVRTRRGKKGWVNTGDLISAETHEAEERLDKELSDLPAQARGHADDVDNIHIAPSRQAAVAAQVDSEQGLEIFGRRVVRRSEDNGPADFLRVSADPDEVWYLVREGSHSGWILGHRVQLDIPRDISAYAQDTNLVAWLVLNTVDDGGRPVPQYLVADRVGTETCDFTDIRVLTWWIKKQTYAIAYHRGGLQGYFPILVTHQGSVPYFRLRLRDDSGARDQAVFGLYDTITRPIGIADTWGIDATPVSRVVRTRSRRVSSASFVGG
ncbi:MAG: SH3 domain-containing protein [Terriglobia bacterium]